MNLNREFDFYIFGDNDFTHAYYEMIAYLKLSESSTKQQLIAVHNIIIPAFAIARNIDSTGVFTKIRTYDANSKPVGQLDEQFYKEYLARHENMYVRGRDGSNIAPYVAFGQKEFDTYFPIIQGFSSGGDILYRTGDQYGVC